MKIKIVHKGVILVAIPLIFGTGFISLLCLGLSQLERLVQRELLLKDASICHIIALRSAVLARQKPTDRRTIAYRLVHEPKYRRLLDSAATKAATLDEHVEDLLKNEPYLLKAARHTSSLQIIDEHPSGLITTSKFLSMLEQATEIQAEAATRELDALQSFLYGGIAIGALLSVVPALFFCLHITNRLLIILHNTVSLSKGTNLRSPLKGRDEISELDQFLFKSGTEIKRLERFKQEMIGVVSHELKSPLSSIGIFLASLSAGILGQINSKAQQKADRTYKSVEKLNSLVAELLYLDRLDLEMKLEQISVNELVAASVEMVKELSKQYGIQVVVKSHDGMTVADLDRLLRLNVNLLSNALRRSPSQGQVAIEAKLSNGWFECRVSDYGRGLSEGARQQIFEPFKQVDDATTEKGTGLGLTICRAIVEKCGGMIGVESAEGMGNTIWYKIPVSELSTNKNKQAAESWGNKQQLQQLDVHVDVHGKTAAPQLNELKGTRKFSVLQQGLVIISVPLIFQISFGFFIGNLLDQIRQQIHREENATEAVASLNQMAATILTSTNEGMQFMFTRTPSLWKKWTDGRDQCFASFARVEKFCANDPEEMSEIRNTRESLVKFSSYADKEKATIVDTDQETNLWQIFRRFQDLISNPEAIKELYPLFDMLQSQERLMARERAIGERLGAQRIQMIRNLESTFLWGSGLNYFLSLFLAVFLMRNISNRLQHVMENTSKLVKSETLDPPLKGGDEIAYLDQVLFETGNRLLELKKFKKDLISIVSHELTHPLLSISLALELFGSGMFGELSEKGMKRLRATSEEANRLVRLVNDLLDIERMEAGKFILCSSDTKVSDLVQKSIAAVAQLAEVKRIRLEYFVDDPETSIYADRDRLCQVLINLLSNAIKFSSENEFIKVTVQQAEENELRFSVIDRGKGIPVDVRQKIFERFVQVEENDAKELGGSGLGLAIARAIVEQHGGTIGVDSALGAGSIFWFQLPVFSGMNAFQSNSESELQLPRSA